MRAALYWKRVTDPFSEGNVAVTISTSSSVAWVSWAERGANKTAPIDVENAIATASGTSHATPDVTTTSDRALVLCCYAVDASSTWTPPSGFTEEADTQPAAAAPAVMVCWKTQDTLGATGAKTGVSSGTGAGVAQIAAVAPLAGITLTRVVPASLALRVLGTDSDGAFVEVEDLLGELASASVVIDPADAPLYILDLYGRSQVVDKNRSAVTESALDLATTYGTAIDGSSPNQRFTATSSNVLSKVRLTVRWASTGGTIYLRLAPDDTVLASAVGGSFSDEVGVAVAGDGVTYEKEFVFASKVRLIADATYWIQVRASSITGSPEVIRYFDQYDSTDNSARVFGFKLISARLGIKSGIHATDGELITIDSVTIEHDPEGVPYVVFGAAESIYHQNGVLANTTAAQDVTFDTLCAVNDVLRIDVAARTVTNLTADEDVSHTVEWSVPEGLQVSSGANTFSWTEAGLVAETVTVTHYGTWE